MIDALFARYGRFKEKPLDPDYKPRDAIRGAVRLNTGADNLAVIFPGWHMHKFPVNKLVERLYKHGWGVIAYDFHDQILLPDDEVVVESLRHIRDEITKELNYLTAKNHYARVHLIGISLGNVPLALVADKFSGFSGATLVVAGDDLAIDMWYGLRTVDIRRQFEKIHLGIRRLDSDWQGIAPINRVRHFARKKVVVIMSLHDKFIRTRYQQKLVERILEIGGDVEVKKSRVGHTLSIVRYCFAGPLP